MVQPAACYEFDQVRRFANGQPFEEIDDPGDDEQGVDVVTAEMFRFDGQRGEARFDEIFFVLFYAAGDGCIRRSIKRRGAEQHRQARIEGQGLDHAVEGFVGQAEDLIGDDFKS